MRPFITGLVAAAVLALTAAFVMGGNQESVTDAFQTSGVRL